MWYITTFSEKKKKKILSTTLGNLPSFSQQTENIPQLYQGYYFQLLYNIHPNTSASQGWSYPS